MQRVCARVPVPLVGFDMTNLSAVGALPCGACGGLFDRHWVGGCVSIGVCRCGCRLLLLPFALALKLAHLTSILILEQA